jgi:hypothetical protein
MMSIADKMGLGPKRVLTKNFDGVTYTLTVTPPAWSGFEPGRTSQLILTKDQVDKYTEWLHGKWLIQDAFPELTNSQRETILTGIPNDEFKKMAEEENDD